MSKGLKRKHLNVEKKSDKDLFSLSEVPENLDVVENIKEEELLESSSEDESKLISESEDSDTEAEESDSSEVDENSESDEAIDEKLIADDSSDEEAEVGKKGDFGFSSLLISSSVYVKKKKLEKYISKQNVNVTRCMNVYSNTYLVCCETREQAQSLMAPDINLEVKGSPLKVSKLPLYVILENLPNYIGADDVKKAVASCIEQSTIKNIIFLHINKCIVEFSTEQALEKFTKKVSKLNVSGKNVRLVPWLEKLVREYSLRCIKMTHLPPNINVEIVFRKLLEHEIKSKEIYQIKFFTRSVCSVYFESEETEKKLLALDGKMQFVKGPIFMNLSTPKVNLLGLPHGVSEKSIRAAFKVNEINLSKIASVKVECNTALVELKTKEEEQKILELDSVLEIEGVAIKILPLAVSRKNYITLGLLKLRSSVSKADVLKALADVGHLFNEDEVQFQLGEKNSIVLIQNGNEDLQKQLSALKTLNICKSSVKVSFCKFGSSKENYPSNAKKNQKRAQRKKKKKNKSKRNDKQKAEAAESG